MKQRAFHNYSRPSTGPIVCTFCSSQHFSNACRIVTSIADRISIIEERNLCKKCFGPHSTESCFKVKRCYYCQSFAHNQALCPHYEQGGSKGSSILSKPVTPPFVPSGVPSPVNSPAERPSNPSVTAYTYAQIATPTESLPPVGAVQFAVSMLEFPLFSTPKAPVLHPDQFYFPIIGKIGVKNPSTNKKFEVNFLASVNEKETLISKHLCQHLELIKSGTGCQTHEYGKLMFQREWDKILIELTNESEGKSILEEAIAIPYLVPDQILYPYPEEDMKYITQCKLKGDYLLPLVPMGTRIPIDLVLSNDCFLTMLEGKFSLPSGLTAIQFPHGFLLAGTAKRHF